MSERALEFYFETSSSTLELYGPLEAEALPRLLEAVDRSFRSSPCRLTVDLSGVDDLPAHTLGRLVHVCNTCYPGTLIRLPQRRPAPRAAAPEMAVSA